MIVDRFPVSYGQRGILFIEELSGSAHAYHDWEIFRLIGPLDLRLLSAAVELLASRHSVLRSRFVTLRDEQVQVVDDRWLGELSVHRLDGDASAATSTDEFLSRVTRQPFDLVRGPLFRVDVLVLRQDEHVFALTMHHLITDGWSVKLMLQEISETYSELRADRQARPSQPATQYRDFVTWQRRTLQGPELDRLQAYWLEHLAGAPTELRLGSPRSSGPGREPAETIEFVLSGSVVAELRRFARACGATLFMALLATFELVLAQAARTRDLLVGVPVAGRTSIEFAESLGLFVNLLALRADLRDDPDVTVLMRRVRKAVLGGFAHQDLPFDQLVSAVNPVRSPHVHPLVQVTIQLVDASFDSALLLDGVQAVAIPVGQQEITRALVLDLIGQGEGIRGRLAFDPAVVDRHLAAAIAARYESLAAELPSRPDDPISTFIGRIPPDGGGTPPLNRAAAGPSSIVKE